MMGRGVGRRATTSPERRAVNRNGARPVAAQSSVSRSAIAAPDPPAEFKQQLLTTDPNTAVSSDEMDSSWMALRHRCAKLSLRSQLKPFQKESVDAL